MRDVLLALGREGLLIACASAEGDDDYFRLALGLHSAQGSKAAERTHGGDSCGGAQELAAVEGLLGGELAEARVQLGFQPGLRTNRITS
ncbi:hypothetical protein GRAN_2401 [Granulicella sibirica]|uniref:Uncharacterized protein n=1 Tax=Granulicella sibirica TaxID=2479048 RepID=A0A4V1L5F1_9BACT|nr:hypothetical protein GRAN_2401 [Granulicella sibirica]